MPRQHLVIGLSPIALSTVATRATVYYMNADAPPGRDDSLAIKIRG